MHNENFSHDTFQYYASKVRTHSRNNAAEEGIAYSWDNAYYTDEQGDDNYLRAINELIGINPSNFNIELRKLLDKYNR